MLTICRPSRNLWGSETPSSSIPDLSATFVPMVLATRTAPKSCSNACSNPGGIHRHVATRGGLKPRDAVNSNGLWRLPPNRALLRFGTVRPRVQIPGPRPNSEFRIAPGLPQRDPDFDRRVTAGSQIPKEVRIVAKAGRLIAKGARPSLAMLADEKANLESS